MCHYRKLNISPKVPYLYLNLKLPNKVSKVCRTSLVALGIYLGSNVKKSLVSAHRPVLATIKRLHKGGSTNSKAKPSHKATEPLSGNTHLKFWGDTKNSRGSANTIIAKVLCYCISCHGVLVFRITLDGHLSSKTIHHITPQFWSINPLTK